MDGRITDANDKFLEMTGYRREDLEHIDWVMMTPPEYRHLDEASVAELAATGVNSAPFEKEYLRKDGTRIPILVAGAMLDESHFDGVAFVVDITERKRAEERLRENEQQLRDIIDGSPTSIVFLKDLEGRFITINKRLEALLGTSREVLRGKTDYDIFPPEKAEYYREHDRRIAETGESLMIEEIADLADGKRHTFLASKFPLRDPTGRLYGVGAVSQDISQIKETEEALRQNEQRLREAETLSRTMNSIHQLIHSTRDSDEMMPAAIREAAAALGGDSAALSLREADGWRIRYVQGLPPEAVGSRMNDDEERHAVLAIKAKQPVVVNDAYNDDRLNREHMKKWGVRSVLVVPLVIGDEAIGVVFFNYQRRTSFFSTYRPTQ
jgi:PAS domain S-box-containing protein